MEEKTRQKEIFSYENYVKNSRYLSSSFNLKREGEPRRVSSVDGRGGDSGARSKARKEKPALKGTISRKDHYKAEATDKARLTGSQKIEAEKPFLTYQDTLSDYEEKKIREREIAQPRVSFHREGQAQDLDQEYGNEIRTRIISSKEAMQEHSRSMQRPLSLSELRSPLDQEVGTHPPGKSEVKNSKAYISAMKALQGKIKQIEKENSERIRGLEESLRSKDLELEKVKLKESERSNLFEALEENLKTKLKMLEQENGEKGQLVAILSKEKEEIEGCYKSLLVKNRSETEDKSREIGELKRILQQERDRGLFLEQNIENLRAEVARLRKLKNEHDVKWLNQEEELKKQQVLSAEREKKLEEQNTKFAKELDEVSQALDKAKKDFLKEKQLLEEELRDSKDYCHHLADDFNELERINQQLEQTLQEVDKRCLEYEEKLEKLQKTSISDRSKSKADVEREKVKKKLSEAKYKMKEKELKQIKEASGSQKASSGMATESLNNNKLRANLLYLSPTSSNPSDMSLSNIEQVIGSSVNNEGSGKMDNLKKPIAAPRKENLNPLRESKSQTITFEEPAISKRTLYASPGKMPAKEPFIDIYRERSNDKEKKNMASSRGALSSENDRNEAKLNKKEAKLSQTLFDEELRSILNPEAAYEQSNKANTEYVELVKKAARLEYELQELKEKYKACSQTMINNSGLPSEVTSVKNKLLEICERIEIVSEELFFIKNTRDRYIKGNLNFALT